jgi:hypothetical protein
MKDDPLPAFLLHALFKRYLTAFAFYSRLHDQLILTPLEAWVKSSLASKELRRGRTLSLLPLNAGYYM